MPKISWNPKTANYIDEGGNIIDPKTVRQWVDIAVDENKAKLKKLAEQFIKDRKLEEFTTQAEPLIRKAHSGVAQIASGGSEQMTPSLRGKLGSKVKFELDHFKQFWLGIERGELSDAEILSRIGMYADSPIGTYEGVRLAVMIDAGFTEALNILNEGANHCTECPGIVGWIKLEKFKPPGSRSCMSRCRCGVEYR